MKILMIYESRKQLGGTQIHVFTLSNALRKLGHDVILFPVFPMPVEGGYLCMIMAFLMQPFLCFIEFLRIIQIMNKREINLVHAHNARAPLVLAYLICKITRNPFVVTVHEAWSLATRINRLYTVADQIIAVSQETKAVLETYNVEKDKIVYIPNMFGREYYDPTGLADNLCAHHSDLVHKLVFIGVLTTGKISFLKVLLETTPRILEKMPSTEVHIVGDGPMFPEVHRMVTSLNRIIGRKVIFTEGYLAEPAEMFKTADIVLGVGRVAIEAMACGKPVIVGSSRDGLTFTGGLVNIKNMRDFERYNFTGRNHSRRMNAQQLARLIIYLLESVDYRKKIGESTKKYAIRKFGTESVAEETASVYFSCFQR